MLLRSSQSFVSAALLLIPHTISSPFISLLLSQIAYYTIVYHNAHFTTALLYYCSTVPLHYTTAAIDRILSTLLVEIDGIASSPFAPSAGSGASAGAGAGAVVVIATALHASDLDRALTRPVAAAVAAVV